VTKAPIDLASHFRWHGDAFDDGQLIDTISRTRTAVITAGWRLPGGTIEGRHGADLLKS
jgi:hypothetical protein